MECKDIHRQLPAFMENDLSPDEIREVDEHLKGCPGCARSFNELKKTVGHLRGLEEVEPPSWLTRKVMEQVREDAEGRRGILRKLFYPLHIKVPVEIFATLAIAVTAFYLFRSVEPDIETYVSKEPVDVTVTVGEGKKEQARKDAVPELRAASPGKPDAEEMEQRMAPAPEETRKRALTESDALTGVDRNDEAQSAPQKASEPVMREQEKSVATMLGRKNVVTFEDADPGDSNPEVYSGAAFRRAEDEYDEDIGLVVLEIDKDRVLEEVRKVLIDLTGKVIRRESTEESEIMIVTLHADRIGELVRELRRIGEVKQEMEERVTVEGPVEVRIELLFMQEERNGH